MSSSVAMMVLFSALAADGKLPSDTVFQYQGSLAVEEEVPAGKKTFRLTLFFTKVTESGAQLHWLVEEEEPGAWPWSERFGRLSLDARLKPTSNDDGPSLLFEYDGGKSVVPLLLPLIQTAQPLQVGLKWKEGKFDYQVEADSKQSGEAVWQVTGSDPFGRKRKFAVRKSGPMAVEVEQRLFLNMGTAHRSVLSLQSSQRLVTDKAQLLAGTFDELIRVRDQLKVRRRIAKYDWNADQLKVLREALPRLKRLTQTGLLTKTVLAMEKDFVAQSKRDGAVNELIAQHLGTTVENFSVDQLVGDPVSLKDLKSKATVLHFWSYRDSPLEEPYGQVGYLDFLFGKRKKAGVKVYGIAVDTRFGQEAKRRQAMTSTRKLRAFMNLSYPILLDDGTLLKKFGDPRQWGADLPLWVVIDSQGKITHYKVGFYKIDRDRGLLELDDAVIKTARQGR